MTIRNAIAFSLAFVAFPAIAYAGTVTVRAAPAEVNAKRGEVPKVRLTLENRSADKVRVILRRDGNLGAQQPLVGWSLRPLGPEDPRDKAPLAVPATAPFGYHIVPPIRPADFFTIAPSEGTYLSDFFALPSDLSPGRYRAVFYYIFEPQKKGTGFVIGKNEPKVEGLLRKATPCKLLSNEIVLTVTE